MRAEAGEVTIVRVASEERHVLKNLWPLYLYDLWPYSDGESAFSISPHGIVGNDEARSYEEATRALDSWWHKPHCRRCEEMEVESVFPFLIVCCGEIAGFAVATTPPHASREVHYRMNDFFIVNRARRLGVGRRAAMALFEHFQGRWEVGFMPGNLPAQRFWRRVVADWTQGRFTEGLVPDGPDEAAMPGLLFSTAHLQNAG